MKKRVIYRVMYNAKRKQWDVYVGKRRIPRSPGYPWVGFTKAEAVRRAREYARQEFDDGFLSQLVVHGRDGRIQTEHTYGRDPKRTPG